MTTIITDLDEEVVVSLYGGANFVGWGTVRLKLREPRPVEDPRVTVVSAKATGFVVVMDNGRDLLVSGKLFKLGVDMVDWAVIWEPPV